MSTYPIDRTTRQELRQARRLGPPPPTLRDRRRRADALLSSGTTTLAALARAWYAGDTAAAKAWYGSPAYQDAVKHRFAGADYRVFITEGL
jgi:hypothetical protein